MVNILYKSLKHKVVPKIILEFDSTEEKEEALDAIRVYEYRSRINKALEFMRRANKYDDALSAESLSLLEKLREILWAESE